MARIVGTTIKDKWFEVKVVGERVEEGQLIITLDEESLKFNRRSPWYWWWFAKGAVILVKEAVVSRLRRTN